MLRLRRFWPTLACTIPCLGGRYFGWYYLFGGNSFFPQKGGWLAVSKRGPVPPFSLKKGASAPFLREKGVPAKKMIPKCTDRDFLWYRYGKYREIPTDTNQKIPIRYTTLHFSDFYNVPPSVLACRMPHSFSLLLI